MDFHSLLSAAKQNISGSKNKGNYYSTSFAPPKKETKEKRLSNNIKKFLEKQKWEEEEKERLAREKKQEMLAKRDPKIQRKIDKTLKVIKSSKKFYTGDKNLDENTAVTLENDQPDEDDYGFASSTSDIYHQKLMEKYQKLPKEEKFSSSRKGKASKSSANSQDDEHHFTNGHRDRVSQIKGEPKQTPRASSKSQQHQPEKKIMPAEKPKPRPKAAPPVDFHALLKLAEQKQHEEIMIAVPTKKEPERLLTSKEKKELEELEASRKNKHKPPLAPTSSAIPKIPKVGAIPKLGESSANHDRNNNDNGIRKPIISKSNPNGIKTANSSLDRNKTLKPTTNSPQASNSKLRDALSKPEKTSPKMPPPQAPAPSSSKSSTISKSREAPAKNISSMNGKPSTSREVVKTREFPPRDVQKTREFPPRDLVRTREFPPRDLKRPRDDIRRAKVQQQISNKRRIIDDDEDDSEYDSEMDDFIDDDDEEIDVSSVIGSIFRYNRNKYQDDNDFDDREMESNFQEVMKEEIKSAKIGRQEDLIEELREKEELRLKALRKKQKMKRHS